MKKSTKVGIKAQKQILSSKHSLDSVPRVHTLVLLQKSGSKCLTGFRNMLIPNAK